MAFTVLVPLGGTAAADPGFNRIEGSDPPQCLGRGRRTGSLVNLVELPPRVRLTRRQHDLAGPERLEPSIAVDL